MSPVEPSYLPMLQKYFISSIVILFPSTLVQRTRQSRTKLETCVYASAQVHLSPSHGNPQNTRTLTPAVCMMSSFLLPPCCSAISAKRQIQGRSPFRCFYLLHRLAVLSCLLIPAVDHCVNVLAVFSLAVALLKEYFVLYR